MEMLAQNLEASEVLDLCAGIHTHTKGQLPTAGSRTLGLFSSIRLILLTLRHHLTQKPCSRSCLRCLTPRSAGVVNAYTPLIAEVLQVRVSTVEDPHPTQQLNLRRYPPSCAGPGASIQSCTRANTTPPESISRWPAPRREDVHGFHSPSQPHTLWPHSTERLPAPRRHSSSHPHRR